MSSLVGKKAPLFKSGAVIKGGEIVEDFSLEQFLGKKHVVFFLLSKRFHICVPNGVACLSGKIK